MTVCLLLFSCYPFHFSKRVAIGQAGRGPVMVLSYKGTAKDLGLELGPSFAFLFCLYFFFLKLIPLLWVCSVFNQSFPVWCELTVPLVDFFFFLLWVILLENVSHGLTGTCCIVNLWFSLWAISVACVSSTCSFPLVAIPYFRRTQSTCREIL